MSSPQRVDVVFFDLSASPFVTPAQERFVEIFTKIGVGVILAWFSVHELFSEIKRFRTLRQHGSSLES